MKTRKGAASIYIVIFTTTLLGIIALSFVRLMLAESLRTTNYNLSQSAYNSALAGIEDAKIVLLRYQSCINNGAYASGGGKTGTNCQIYKDLFGSYDAASTTSQSCSVVGKLLHPSQSGGNEKETLIQTRDNYDTGTIDQAYTCVKIAAYTEDFLATLSSKNPTKLVPLRSDSDESQTSINRIQIQWFDDQNYLDVADGDGFIKDEYSGFWKKGNKTDLTGTTVSNVGNYALASKDELGNGFSESVIVPPAIQATLIQTSNAFTMGQFYASEGTSNTSKTNRGTLMFRPTSNKDMSFFNSRKLSTLENGNHSNMLPQNALAYSANKSYNTPMDIYCQPNDSTWGNYACSADFYVPSPIGDGSRNMSTSFLVLNLPYGGPQTDVSVKMLSCKNPSDPINSMIDASTPNCKVVYFANVQPMVDSTGRANDLFRRVESRIELADTNFPIANYALAMTDPTSKYGITKDYYATDSCQYSSSYYDNESMKILDAHGCGEGTYWGWDNTSRKYMCINGTAGGKPSDGSNNYRRRDCLNTAKNDTSDANSYGNGDGN